MTRASLFAMRWACHLHDRRRVAIQAGDYLLMLRERLRVIDSMISAAERLQELESLGALEAQQDSGRLLHLDGEQARVRRPS